jgi:hypothetical protein
MIFPSSGASQTELIQVTTELQQVAQPGSVKNVTGAVNGLAFWQAIMTLDQASEISNNPIVSPIRRSYLTETRVSLKRKQLIELILNIV